MKKIYDEPLYIEKTDVKKADKALQTEIENILSNESFAVLSTQGDGQPFSSLITYSCDENFKKIVFATPLLTRKFDLISKNEKVSIMIDTRSSNPESINEIIAITATGKAFIIEDKEQKALYESLLVKKHPYLKTFVNATSTAIIAVNVDKYNCVKKFQEVTEWSLN